MLQTTAEMARRLVREHNAEAQRKLQEKADEEIKAIENQIIAKAKAGGTSYPFTTSVSLYPLVHNAFKEAGFKVVGLADSSGTIDWADATVSAVET